MKSCNKCLVTETADTITYDAAGTCSVCVQHETKHRDICWDHKLAELEGIADAVRGRGEYDCILPFSGGKDSCFQLLYLIKDLRLKPLVVRVNHHFYRPQVQANVIEAQRRLGFDMLEFTPNWRVWRQVMVQALMRRGDSCWPCHTSIYSYPMKVALEKKIPLIVWGETLNEYQSWGVGGFEEEVGEYRFNRAMNMGITADDMYEFLEHFVPRRDLEPFAYPSGAELTALGVRSLCLGSFIRWDTKANVERIKAEIGWKGDTVEGIPPQFDYEKIECKSQGLRDWLRYLKRGQGRTAHLANIDIRQGRMSREEGSRLAAEFDGKEPASLGYMLEQMGITREEFYQIALSHVVDPWEPNVEGAAVGVPLPDMAKWA